MRTKILKRGLPAVVLIGFAVLFSQRILFFPTEQTPVHHVQVQGNIGTPTRIKIPAIHIDAIIEAVGVTPDGSMDIPSQALTTAWYKLGTKPGMIGSAVIDGHVNWKDGTNAVFADLHNLKPGDKVIIQDDQAVSISFVVRGSRSFDPKADAADVFTSNDGKAHLNLITCEGVWNKAASSYSQRLVVFTDKE